MIVRQMDKQEPRQILAGAHIQPLHFLNKLCSAELIGDVGVVVGIVAGRVLIQRIGHGDIR